jgi:hypothetical protein
MQIQLPKLPGLLSLKNVPSQRTWLQFLWMTFQDSVMSQHRWRRVNNSSVVNDQIYDTTAGEAQRATDSVSITAEFRR